MAGGTQNISEYEVADVRNLCLLGMSVLAKFIASLLRNDSPLSINLFTEGRVNNSRLKYQSISKKGYIILK